MQKVLTAAQMRVVDRLTTEKYGIPSIILMENAAHAVARVITEKLDGSVRGKSILILCGPGNNGGDGAALARILAMEGACVDALLFGKVEETKGDARINYGVLGQNNFEYDDNNYHSNFCELREIGSKDEWVRFYIDIGQHCNVMVDAIFLTQAVLLLAGVLSAAMFCFGWRSRSQYLALPELKPEAEGPARTAKPIRHRQRLAGHFTRNGRAAAWVVELRNSLRN